MRENKLTKYILLTFSISWTLWIGLALLANYELIEYGQTPFMIIHMLGALSPFISAIIIKRADKHSFKRFIGEIFKVRVHVLWYLGIIVLPLIISGTSWLINLAVLGNVDAFLTKPIYTAFALLPIMIIGGGLEELGWRGVILPEILKKKGPLSTALIVGIIWGIWHTPLFYINNMPYDIVFITFVLRLIAMSLLLTVLYLSTRSIFLCVLFHSIDNAYINIGMNSWVKGSTSQIINALTILAFSAVIFIIYYKISYRKMNIKTKVINRQ